jgi:hypothetical protein
MGHGESTRYQKRVMENGIAVELLAQVLARQTGHVLRESW